jgi:tetratricopeptide (TPR) repeat protein
MKNAGLLTAACICLQLFCTCARQSAQRYSEATLQRYLTARKYYSEQRFEGALKLLLDNHNSAPAFSANSFLIGKIYYFDSEYEQAERYWLHTLQLNPHHLDTRKWLARLYLQQDRVSEAQKILVVALENSSEDPGLLILMAKVKHRQQDLAAAIELYKKSQAFGERLSEASLDLAKIYSGFGLKDKAEQEMQRAFALLGQGSGISAHFDQSGSQEIAP